MVELIPDVHLVDGSVGCNTYFLVDEDGITLIDTGLRGNVAKIYASLSRIGYGPESIKRIIVTHAHLDHINCLARLREDSNARIMVSEKDAGIVSGKEPLKTPNGIVGMMFGVIKTYYKYKPVPVDVVLKDGDELNILGGLQVILLEGHEPGNIGLYCPSRKLLVSSDSIRVSEDKLMGPHPGFTPDMKAAIDSIRKISLLEFDIMLPGHGPPVLSNASKKVRELCRELKCK
ncbi:MBL fold metallo-hydrolase [Methanocella sp. CWC-04]|uniref:MBL fold metallo-hydrolase n=1 Tax=Methanooceanicella nereidis TaxID=2052831 RepID=A0AAP2R9W2_9EURY|nr:MBL fold metallo-hydrolase [Methanocella sp. CWC-04]MCD1293584.1 MBL fold metallo-hydrolase [Methanocella sp. CWC-04]